MLFDLKLSKEIQVTKIAYLEGAHAQDWFRMCLDNQKISFVRAIMKQQISYGEKRMDRHGAKLDDFMSIYSFGDTDCLLILQSEKDLEEYEMNSAIYIKSKVENALEYIDQCTFENL